MSAIDHWLYRCFDGEERLLYVGITSHGMQRFRSHSRDKDWWATVETIKLEHFASRAEVIAAEASAIRAERPVHNIVHAHFGEARFKPGRVPPPDAAPLHVLPAPKATARERRLLDADPDAFEVVSVTPQSEGRWKVVLDHPTLKRCELGGMEAESEEEARATAPAVMAAGLVEEQEQLRERRS